MMMTICMTIYNFLTALVVAGLNVVDSHPMMALGAIIIVGTMAGFSFNETKVIVTEK